MIEELEVSFDDVVEPEWDKTAEAWLRLNPPTRSQYRKGRRSDPSPVIVVHTAQSGTDMAGADPKAEGVADYIRRRSTAGSYHLLGDADSVLQLVRFSDEAYHVMGGYNRSTIGISLAINAEDWPKMTAERRGQFVHTAASMAAYGGHWHFMQGRVPPPAKFLTKAEVDAGETGITSHGRLDPGRRSDPGPMFPWRAFLRRYQDLVEVLTGHLLDWGADDRPVETWALYVEAAQEILGVTADGAFGPKTLAALESLDDERDNYRSRLDQIAAIADPG